MIHWFEPSNVSDKEWFDSVSLSVCSVTRSRLSVFPQKKEEQAKKNQTSKTFCVLRYREGSFVCRFFTICLFEGWNVFVNLVFSPPLSSFFCVFETYNMYLKHIICFMMLYLTRLWLESVRNTSKWFAIDQKQYTLSKRDFCRNQSA